MPNCIKLLTLMIGYKGLMTHVSETPVGITQNNGRMP